MLREDRMVHHPGPGHGGLESETAGGCKVNDQLLKEVQRMAADEGVGWRRVYNDDLRQICQELLKMREMLDDHQFCAGEMGCCPECDRNRGQGHLKYCSIGKLLADGGTDHA
jgi:hypothetical protein